jgi:uncharacterized protein with PIN domain
VTQFLLAHDLNLGIARWLRGRGHDLKLASELGLEAGDWPALLGSARGQQSIVISHDQRLVEAKAEAGSDVLVLLVPQPSLDDIPRVAESVHQLISGNRAIAGSCMRLGLRSGWATLP